MTVPDPCFLCGHKPAMDREGRWVCECDGGINAGPVRDSEHAGWDARQRKLRDRCADAAEVQPCGE
jgi:hypothetical protein